ncbi:hypothetical protein [Halorussus sp. AFM4]|uniref:hypothetical protein n=1 Tax=Halorussus sp. AFM4 TaxID=3421651 RepID=UPI003EBBE2AF
MIADPSDLVSDLRDDVGEGLRVVGEYSAEGYDLHYVREDVRPKVEEMNTDRVHRELVLQGVGREYLEDLFDAGSLQCSVHRFDELAAYHFVRDENTGGYVSVDTGATVRPGSLVETVGRYL